jgi:hypothetical protein
MYGVQTEHRRSVGADRIPAVVEESRPAECKENLVVEGMVSLVVKRTVARLVAVGRVNPVAAEDKEIPAVAGMAVAHSQAEEPHTQTRPEVAETARAY